MFWKENILNMLSSTVLNTVDSCQFQLAAEAKTHSNPENYIHSKYFDKSSEYYETNLTDKIGRASCRERV